MHRSMLAIALALIAALSIYALTAHAWSWTISIPKNGCALIDVDRSVIVIQTPCEVKRERR